MRAKGQRKLQQLQTRLAQQRLGRRQCKLVDLVLARCKTKRIMILLRRHRSEESLIITVIELARRRLFDHIASECPEHVVALLGEEFTATEQCILNDSLNGGIG